MEPVRLWAAVEFTAQSGSTDALLGHAAQAGLHLTRIVPLPGGFRARCAAWHYRPLAALARQGHVRLRVEKRLGLFFRLRPLLRRTGLWAGLALFIPLLLWSQQFVWAVDTSTLTRGQAARAFAVLRQADLAPGAAATEAKRTAGEYALLESGEFSWASLNFAKGRLEVRAAAAVPKPAIAAGTLHGLRARCAGVVTKTNLTSGTMLVVPGQAVEAGQGLIGTARQERDGALIFAPAAGTVRAQLEWSDAQSVPLEETVLQPTGRYTVRYRLSAAGQNWTLPSVQPPEQTLERTRHLQPELLGLPLPCSVEETTFYEQQPQLLRRTEAQGAHGGDLLTGSIVTGQVLGDLAGHQRHLAHGGLLLQPVVPDDREHTAAAHCTAHVQMAVGLRGQLHQWVVDAALDVARAVGAGNEHTGRAAALHPQSDLVAVVLEHGAHERCTREQAAQCRAAGGTGGVQLLGTAHKFGGIHTAEHDAAVFRQAADQVCHNVIPPIVYTA